MKLYNNLDNRNSVYVDKNEKVVLPIYTPFVEQKKNIDRFTIFSIKAPFDLFHIDIGDIKFLENCLVIQNIAYCLLIFLLLKFILTQ